MISLRRVTESTQYIPQIDGLRCIAILSVVLFHIYSSIGHKGALPAPQTSLDLHQLSKRGVELFFAISGFVLALPFARAYRQSTRPPSLGDYFKRRLTRLEPPYLVALLITGGVLLLTRSQSLHEIAPHFLASATYLHYFIFGGNSTIIGPAWSLEIEIQFYLLVPLLTMVFKLSHALRQRILWIAMFGVSLATAWSFKTVVEPTFLYYSAFFLAGFLAADRYLDRQEKQEVRTANPAWDAIAVILLALLFCIPLERTSHVLLPPVLVFLFQAAFQGKYLSRLLGTAIISIIGGMCYTIYLYHVLLIGMIGRVTKPIHFGHSYAAYFLLQACIVVPIILLVSAGLFLLVEKPCMDKRWPSKLIAVVSGYRARFRAGEASGDA